MAGKQGKRWKISIGKVKRLGGILVYAQFFCRPLDETDYRAKYAAITALWKAKLSKGETYWTIDEQREMGRNGLIVYSPRKIKEDEALKLIYDSQADPISNTELGPLCNEDGMVRPDAAVPLVDLIARNIVIRKDFRIELFKQLFEMARTDPKSLFEWCNRNLGWSGSQASTILNILPGTNGAGAIAFDASEEDVIDASEEETTDAPTDDGTA